MRLLISSSMSQAGETFTMRMDDHVPPRKRFTQTHAVEVRNLDV